MFALKSTLAAAIAERDEARALAEKLRAGKSAATMAEAESAYLLSEERKVSARLRAELATTYIRNAKGQWARHPSAPAKVRAA